MTKINLTNLIGIPSKVAWYIFILLMSIFRTLFGQYIIIEINNTALIYRISTINSLQQIYFGESLSNKVDYNQLPNAKIDNWKTGSLHTVREQALQIKQDFGNPSTQLTYVSHQKQVGGNISTKTLELKDPQYAVSLKLYFKAYHKDDVIETWSTLTNKDKKLIVLENYTSASIKLKANSYYI